MKIIAIAGKVDSRVLVYPLARAISLTGLTAVISDDGAYRRLYHGDDLKGTVSGIDISVGIAMNEDLRNSLNNEGMAYDNIILVTSGYIPSDVDGVILCKGIDKSMSAEVEAEEKEVKQVKSKKSLMGKKSKSSDESSNNEEVIEEVKVEKKPDITKQEVKRDTFIVPDGVPFNECYISFDTPAKKGEFGINLKDGLVRYVCTCEERKKIEVLDDKNMNKAIAKLTSTVVGIDETSMLKLLTRSEYTNTGKVK